MKKFLVACILMTTYMHISAQDFLNVMTFNIRYNNPGDSINAWPNRKDLAASQVLFHQVHLLGVQEALYGQITDLQARLPQYKYVGVGRDDGQRAGEFSAIFYDTTRLELLHTQTFWLSETPTVPGSKSWDAAITRIVTWAHFRDRHSGKYLFAFNTHFDHIGKIARKESAELLLQQIKSIAGKTPCIITGDFNAFPTDEPIRVILDEANPDHLINTIEISATGHYGPKGTFNAFGPSELASEPIDHIFIKNNVKVLQHATLSQTWAGRFSSDHFPVFARVFIP